jgi:hypothetical protein
LLACIKKQFGCVSMRQVSKIGQRRCTLQGLASGRDYPSQRAYVLVIGLVAGHPLSASAVLMLAKT